MTDEHARHTSRRMFMALGGAAAIGSGVLGATAVEAATMTETDRKNVEVVKAMSAAWKTGDAALIASYMADTIAFRGAAENMGTPPTVGKENFITSIAGFLGQYDLEMVVHDTFALAPVVVTCHQQLFVSKTDKSQVEDLYIGCFFVENGKIREWNDYAIIPFSQPRKPDTADKAKFFHAV
jgi:limonene-1,2-epoxide hydrolase